jgi:hypothetical protein
MLERTLLLVACAFISSCANFNSGKVDFRRAAELSVPQAEALRSSHLSTCWQTQGKERLEMETRGTRFNRCAAMLPTTLSDKNYGNPENAVKVGDVYSIRLDFGRIQTLGETFGNIRFGTLQSRSLAQQQGEIAVLVNAFEFAPPNTTTGNGGRFYNLGQNRLTSNASNTNSERQPLAEPDYASARVVYFSPDVLRGQSLNLSNIPITAPQKYEGRPIGIQIIVIELDRLSDSTKSLLKGLAELGRTTVGASETTSTLLSLGKSLLEGSNDDVVFEYRFVMDNAADLGGQIVSPFASGRYVFRRSENRNYTQIWNNLRLDQNTGELMVVRPREGQEATPTYMPYGADTYFTVRVINHGPNGLAAIYENATWQQATERFDAFLNTATTLSLGADAIKTKVDELLATRRSLAGLTAINAATSSVSNAWKLYSLQPVGVERGFNVAAVSDYGPISSRDGKNLFQLQCEANWQDRATRTVLALQDAEATTLAMAQSWKDVQGLQPPEEAIAIERFRTGLNTAIGPELTSDRIFAIPSAFKSTFLDSTDGPRLLSSKLQARAATQRPPLSCAALGR